VALVEPAPKGGESAALLLVDGLDYSAGTQALFTAWSCRVAAGVTLVQGGEGAGKTSLLRLLAGEMAAPGGVLRIGPVDLATQPDAYRTRVFLAEPRSEAFDQITLHTYLAMLQARYPSFDGRQVDTLVEGLTLSEHQHKPLYMLSTGSKRKVWFLGAVASGAPLTLLDEPFAALDRRAPGAWPTTKRQPVCRCGA
jgi:ABC-type multidrug transport system ATPase subunit